MKPEGLLRKINGLACPADVPEVEISARQTGKYRPRLKKWLAMAVSASKVPGEPLNSRMGGRW
jgi:hypothetical protein